jgi:hypothetical protein
VFRRIGFQLLAHAGGHFQPLLQKGNVKAMDVVSRMR